MDVRELVALLKRLDRHAPKEAQKIRERILKADRQLERRLRQTEK